MKQIIIILLFIIGFTFSFPFELPFWPFNSKNKSDTTIVKIEKPKSSSFVKAERYKDDLLSRGREIIYGEGIYPIGDDIGVAKIEAKKRAKNDLSQKIKVKVSSDITTILKVNKKNVVQDDFIEQIDTYTEQVLEDVTEADFIDYPKDGNITAFAYISRKKYTDKVAKELSETKARIRDLVVLGDKQFNSGAFMVALRNWLDALDFISISYGKGISLSDDIDGDGKYEDVSSYIKSQINNFYGRLSLGFIAAEISYDANGKVNKNPEVTVHYMGKDGNKKAVSNIPLKIKFEKGDGKVSRDIITGTYGMAAIEFDTLVARTQHISLTVNVDMNKIEGLSTFVLPKIAPIAITMKKIRTVGLYVILSNLGKISTPSDIVNIATNVLKESGYATKYLDLTSVLFNDKDNKIALDNYVDYILVISFKSTGGDTFGGLEMYVSNCSGQIKMYKVKQSVLLASLNILPQKGVSVKKYSAGYKAFSKIKVGFNKKLKKMIEEIR